MSAARVAPTRLNLLKGARRLDRVAKGTSLLRRKREALVGELFRLARPAVDVRSAIATAAATAYPALHRALARHGYAGLRAIGWPGRELTVEIRAGQVWGISVSDLLDQPRLQRTLPARGTPPGSTGGAAAGAATEFEQLAELLVAAAPREALLRRLGEALARTSRQVNTLERRVSPALKDQLATIRRALDEREREEHLRLARLSAKRR